MASYQFALNQENQSLVRLVSQWFDSTLYTSVFKFPPGGAYCYIDIMITYFIQSTLLRNLTLRLSSLSQTIKIEETFGKLSICTESRLSKENQHLAGYQFALNQEYQSLV